MPTRLIVQESAGNVQVLLHRDGHLVPEPSGPAIPFEPSLSLEEREDLRWYLEDYLDAPFAVYEDRGSTIAGRIPACEPEQGIWWCGMGGVITISEGRGVGSLE